MLKTSHLSYWAINCCKTGSSILIASASAEPPSPDNLMVLKPWRSKNFCNQPSENVGRSLSGIFKAFANLSAFCWTISQFKATLRSWHWTIHSARASSSEGHFTTRFLFSCKSLSEILGSKGRFLFKMFEIVPWQGGFSNLNCSFAHAPRSFCVIFDPPSLAFSYIINACSIVKVLVFAPVTRNSFNTLLMVAWESFGRLNSFRAHAAKFSCFIFGSEICFFQIRERFDGESFPFCGPFTILGGLESWHCSDFEHQIFCPNPSSSFPYAVPQNRWTARLHSGHLKSQVFQHLRYSKATNHYRWDPSTLSLQTAQTSMAQSDQRLRFSVRFLRSQAGGWSGSRTPGLTESATELSVGPIRASSL